MLLYFPQLPDLNLSPCPGDGSPVLGGAVLLTQATICPDLESPPPVSLKPDYIKGTANLSPQGKMQVQICSSRSVVCGCLVVLEEVAKASTH